MKLGETGGGLRSSGRRAALALVVLAFGTLGSVLLWRVLARSEEQVLASRFDVHVQERTLAIQRQFEEAAAALQDLLSLLDVSDDVPSERFHRLATPLLARRPALQALSWSTRVAASDRAAHEDQVRWEGCSGYRILEWAGAEHPVPATERQEYVVVRYIVPRAGNEATVGFDLTSEPTRLRALQQARDTGNLSVTEYTTLVEGAERGVLAFLPKYRAGAPHATPADRRANIEGFLVATLRVDDLVEAALDPFEEVGITVELSDGPPPAGIPRGSSLGYGWGGRDLRLNFSTADDYLADQRGWAPVATLVAGLLVTALLASCLSAISGRAARVEREVTLRTIALRGANETLEAEVASRKDAERRLAAHGDELEAKVTERTAELGAANTVLRQEIAHREKAERALRKSEERTRLTVDAITGGGWDWNVKTGEVFFSDSWLASLGYARDELEPDVRSWEELVHPDDRSHVDEVLDDHFAGRTDVFECENRLRMKSGEYRWNLQRGKVVERDESNRPIRMVGTDTDISQRKEEDRVKQRLEAKIQDAQRLESVGLLAGGIAHDFNNLLVGILGNAELALDTITSREVREELEHIKLTAIRAADLTRQMLAYAGKGTFVFEKLDLSELVEEMASLLDSSTPKSAEIRTDLSSRPIVVDGDGTQLRQVAMNLITNASDALEGENGTIEVRTALMEADRRFLGECVEGPRLTPGWYVCFEVTDRGCGMDEETVRRVFDPYFTTKRQGRGLGLASVLGIVRRHGGTVRVASRVGEGTTFTVLLPRALPNEKASTAQGDGEREAWRGSGTVLVVDDEAAVRSVVSRSLRGVGFTVLTAADGRQGLEVFRAHADEIDAVVLDATMPHMDGEETFREIRRIRPDARVILSSGYAEEEALERFSMDGLAAFLQKPFPVSELIGKVRGAIEA